MSKKYFTDGDQNYSSEPHKSRLLAKFWDAS